MTDAGFIAAPALCSAEGRAAPSSWTQSAARSAGIAAAASALRTGSGRTAKAGDAPARAGRRSAAGRTTFIGARHVTGLPQQLALQLAHAALHLVHAL